MRIGGILRRSCRYQTLLLLTLLLVRGAFVEAADYVALRTMDHDAWRLRLPLQPLADSEDIGPFSVLFSGDEHGRSYRFHADRAGWRLTLHGIGSEDEIASGGERLTGGSELDLSIWRGPLLLCVIVDGRMLCEVADTRRGRGVVAFRGRAAIRRPVFQPVAEVRFSDTFMRSDEQQELTPWTHVRGRWHFHSVRENVDNVNVDALQDKKKPKAEMSPNPFALELRSEKPEGSALVTTGHWFWKDYGFEVAGRCTEGAWGIVFNYRGENDYHLVRWPVRSRLRRPTRIELLRVREGRNEALGEAWVMGQADQWYRLAVRTPGSRIQVVLDGSPVIDVFDDASCGGGIGLYSEGVSPVFFDDIDVRPLSGIGVNSRRFIDAFGRTSGDWRVAQVPRRGFPPAAGLEAQGTDGGYWFGDFGWRGCEVSMQALLPSRGGIFRTYVGHAGDGSCYEIRFSGEEARIALWSPMGKERRVLTRCDDIRWPADRPVELRIDGTRTHELRVYLDGRLELRTCIPYPVHGRVGISSSDMPGLRISELTVRFEREEDAERPPKIVRFTEDPYMKLWSSPEGNWWPEEGRANTYWHNGDFYGRSEITLPLRPGLTLIHAATGISEADGYALVQEEHDGESCLLRLLRRGRQVARAVIKFGDVPKRKVTLHKDGRYLWLTAAGRDRFVFRDAKPLPDSRLAVTSTKPLSLGDIEVQRFQVVDYYFEKAPADWHRVGNWDVTNRFTCDPRWSHMAAVTDTRAILFNKMRYEGDFTMEAYMGMRMRTMPPRFRYPRIGDMNLAFDTDGHRLDSGYCFILSGWDPAWSERTSSLLRLGKSVAESHRQLFPDRYKRTSQPRFIANPWVPGRKRGIHGAWYFIRARKHAGRLDYTFDGVSLLEYEDPAPLAGGHPAIWTHDAWIVVARVKFSYRKKTIPGRLVDPPSQREAGPVADAGRPYPVVASYSHPGLSFDFEGSLQGWRALDEEEGPLLRLTSRDGGTALQVTNVHTGGDVAALAPMNAQSIDPLAVESLEFDYRIDPETKINLYMTIGGVRTFVRLTGPTDTSPLCYRLSLPKIEADGQWHRVRLPLARLVSLWQKEHPGTMTSVVFGNLHDGYLRAGIGGNPAGAGYAIDNFRLRSCGGAEFRFQSYLSSGRYGNTVIAVADRKPDTVPDGSRTGLPARFDPGPWYCHLRMRTPEGKLTPAVHFPFYVTGRAPELGLVRPESAERWGNCPLTFSPKRSGGSAVDLGSFAVRLNGVPLEQDEFRVEYDRGEDEILLDLTRLGLELPDGAVVQVRADFRDLSGASGRWTGKLRTALAEDVTPPTDVHLWDEYLCESFERDFGPAQAGSAYIMRDRTTASDGRHSLMITNSALGANFSAYLISRAFDINRFPILAFDYRIGRGVEVDLMLSLGWSDYSIGFADGSEHARSLASLTDQVKTDGQWHHLEVNLLEARKGTPAAARHTKIDWVRFQDIGRCENAPGASFHIDRLRLIPLAYRSQPLRLKLRSADLSGIKGYSYLVDNRPDTEVAREINLGTGEFVVRDLPEGHDVYVHVRACDRAGNWGPVSHLRFYVP